VETKIGKIIFITIAFAVFIGLLTISKESKANFVTMEVDSQLGHASGTYLCKDARTCYMLVRRAEERGANQYCNSVIMSRDGRVIWSKVYL